MTVGFKEKSDFAFENEGTLMLVILRQDNKPFNIVPGSSVCSNLSQIPPQWVSWIFPFSNGNSSGWICSEFIITLSALTKKPHTKAAGVWNGWLLDSLEKKKGRGWAMWREAPVWKWEGTNRNRAFCFWKYFYYCNVHHNWNENEHTLTFYVSGGVGGT